MLLRAPLQALAFALPLFSQVNAQQTACNNSPSLCTRPYNNITHLGAHNSPFLRDESTQFSTSGNHYYSTTVQLSAGVRLLSGQVHKKNDTSGADAWHLCHSRCELLDAGTLSDWLGEIKRWMDANENEVVTILLVNAGDASAAELGAQFEASGISDLAYAPDSTTAGPGQEWPTLDTLISQGSRLVTFVASLDTPDPAHPYLLDEFDHIFENSFEVEQPSDFTCAPDRPSSLSSSSEALDSGRMFLMNHFLYSTQLFGLQTPNDTYINVTNAETGLGSLGEHLGACEGEYGKAPNFVLVDFFNVGPAIASVDAANGVEGAVGREEVSTEQPEEVTSAAATVKGGSVLGFAVAVAVAVGFAL